MILLTDELSFSKSIFFNQVSKVVCINPCRLQLSIVFLVTEDMLQDMAGKVEMNIKEYTSQTFNALAANTSETDAFIYQAVQNDSTLEV